MNMCVCVWVWCFWRAADSPGSWRMEGSSPVKVCSDPLGCALRQGWGWGSSGKCVRGSSSTFQTCAWALHVVLASHPAPGCHQSSVWPCVRQNETSLNESSACVSMRTLEGREEPSSTFYRCPTVLLITHALCWHRKGLLVRGNKLKWGRKWGNQQILMLKVDWR